MKRITIDPGGLGEETEFHLDINYKLDKYDLENKLCSHVKDGVLKYLIVSYTSGYNDSTSVCGECIINAIADYRIKQLEQQDLNSG